MSNVLLVVGNGASPDSRDIAQRDHLTNILGHTVTYIDDGAAIPGNLDTAYQLVVLARSVAFAQTGTKYDPTTVGVISMNLGPHTQTTNAGASSGALQTTEYALVAADPICPGGATPATITILNANGAFAYGYYAPANVCSGAVNMTAGTVGTASTRIVNYRVDVGGSLFTGTAPSRRVRLDIMDFLQLNATGLTWFNNAVTWAMAGNVYPVANAGPDQTVSPGATVTLTSAASTDTSPGTIVSQAWTLVSGTGGTLSNASAVSPTYTAAADVNGSTDVWQVLVTDDGGLTNTDTVSITVSPVAYMQVRSGGAWVRKRLRTRTGGAWV